MDMPQYCLKALGEWYKFSGRSTRGEFWSFHFMALLVLISLFIGYFSTISALGISVGQTLQTPLATAYLLLALATMIFLFIASVALTVRRLHDRGQSGKWYLFYALLSIIQSGYAELNPTGTGEIAFGVFLAASVLSASALGLVLMCLPGIDGINEYGNDPKRPIDLNVFA